jgi:hypothetical protein
VIRLCNLRAGRGRLPTRVSNPGARNSPVFIPGFPGVMRQVVSGVPVDDEAPTVTSRISRSAGAQSFGCAHRDRVCVRIRRGE